MKSGKKLSVFIDGAARGNPGHGACAVVFFGSGEDVLCEEGKYLGRCTNNFAEYSALRLALVSAARIGAEELEVFSGSGLLVRQYGGQCRVTDPALAEIAAVIRKAAARFRKVSLSRVTRDKNREADRLVDRILDNARHAPPGVDRTLAREQAAPARPGPF